MAEVNGVDFNGFTVDHEDNLRVLAGVRREEGKGELEFFDRHVDSIRVFRFNARVFFRVFSMTNSMSEPCDANNHETSNNKSNGQIKQVFHHE